MLMKNKSQAILIQGIVKTIIELGFKIWNRLQKTINKLDSF